MWEISNQMLKPIEDAKLAENHVEAELETWIAEAPDILGNKLLIIDRQHEIDDVGRLDLLGIDENGSLMIIELKRDRTPREAIAQALDYASWLDSAKEEEIRGSAEAYLKQSLEDAYSEYFGKDLAELSLQNHRIALVAPRLDASSERIIKYLAERYRVNINAVFFQYARLSDGREILARTMLVPEESRLVTPQGRRSPTTEELIAAANERGTAELVEICRRVRGTWKEENTGTYGGSFRYWKAPLGEKQERMIFGVNVMGKNAPPRGELDVWIPVLKLSKVTGLPEEKLRAGLEQQNVLEMRSGDCWIRLRSADEAKRLTDQFRAFTEDALTATA